MKRTLLLLLVAASLTGCKKNVDEDPVDTIKFEMTSDVSAQFRVSYSKQTGDSVEDEEQVFTGKTWSKEVTIARRFGSAHVVVLPTDNDLEANIVLKIYVNGKLENTEEGSTAGRRYVRAAWVYGGFL